MVGSPNFVRFVYDGDGTIGDPGPPGSDVIEEVFTDFFNERGLASEPTEFDGRSDYFAFIQNDIPAGGLFSGAEGIKTAAQAGDLWRHGGSGLRCLLPSGLRHHRQPELPGAPPARQGAAHAVLYFAHDEGQRPSGGRCRYCSAPSSAASSADYRGPHLVR